MSAELFDLTGRIALITGSSQGIGYTLAKGLASAGATVVLNARNAEKLKAAAERLRAEGARVHTARARLAPSTSWSTTRVSSAACPWKTSPPRPGTS